MAYAVLLSLAQTINQILNDDRFTISDNGKNHITSLLQHVVFLQQFLVKFPNEGSNLEVRIRDAANEAEDHLERLMYDQIRRSHHMWRFYKSTIDNAYDFDELIKEAMEKINSISREAADFKTTETVVFGDTPTVRSLPVFDGVTVGLEEDLLKIKDMVCGLSSKLEVIPIVGMGGIGKTTLAQKAYHDQLIEESFHVRAWVTVSQDYKPQNIFADLLQQFCKGVGNERSGKGNDFPQDKVYKFLKGRKYLIVLDDIWSTKAWDEVKRIFPDDGNGSRIVLTTREEDVASFADSYNYLHRMQFMESDQSWDLLKQKVFPEKDCPPELEDIGKRISISCGGLPLAVVLVAGILSGETLQTRVAWSEVADKVLSAIDGEDGHFEKIISLSYTHLPHHLRPCFLYMGGFPEDYEIRISNLTKLWIAEGFVEPRDGESLEERAEEYLEDLVKRSLALVKKRKSNGKIKSCNVHDLVRDICKRKAMEEDYQRRLSIDHHDLMFLARASGSTLRSVICFRSSESSLPALKLFRLLRVLDVVKAYIDSFPAQVFDLFHLRYLGFTLRRNLVIPEGISRLQNLETLIIYPMWKTLLLRYMLCLPFEICMMPLLRHLVTSYPLLLDIKGVKVGKLEKLVTLSMVRRFKCTKKVIEMIPNIKKLGIIIHHGEREGYQLHNLVLLRQLEKFKLVMEGNSLALLKVNVPVFPETLKKLVLEGCGFPWKYMEVVGSLPNLQVLKLRNHGCKGDTWETNEEQFPSLELLWIDSCYLKKWVTERSHFPRLKRLVLFGCSNLKEIPDDIGEIPTLQLLEVITSNKSLVECAKRIREEQHDNGNYGLEVRYDDTVKVILKLDYADNNTMQKAMQKVSGLSGLESIALDPKEKKLTVTGAIDPIAVVAKLRKICNTEIV